MGGGGGSVGGGCGGQRGARPRRRRGGPGRLSSPSIAWTPRRASVCSSTGQAPRHSVGDGSVWRARSIFSTSCRCARSAFTGRCRCRIGPTTPRTSMASGTCLGAYYMPGGRQFLIFRAGFTIGTPPNPGGLRRMSCELGPLDRHHRLRAQGDRRAALGLGIPAVLVCVRARRPGPRHRVLDQERQRRLRARQRRARPACPVRRSDRRAGECRRRRRDDAFSDRFDTPLR